MPSPPPRPRTRRRARIATLLTAAVVLGAVSALPPADPASAVVTLSEQRLVHPVVAGSLLRQSIIDCTAGPVLLKDSDRASADPRTRATRYVLTAKHCFAMGSLVAIGHDLVRSAPVVWQSATEDMELIRIDPHSERHNVCHARFKGVDCSSSTVWIPQASGQIVTKDEGGAIVRRAVTASGPPTAHPFCTSGISSSVNCSWYNPPDVNTTNATTFIAVSMTSVEPGDSGGPVFSPELKMLGMITEALPHRVRFLRIDSMMAALPGYSVARN
jgi:S1-C subfamily serine protease